MSDLSDRTLYWDNDFYEKREERYGRILMAVVGISIFSLLMGFAAAMILSPLLLPLGWAFYQQRATKQLLDQNYDASIQLSPKSLLLSQPALKKEQRLNHREIKNFSFDAKARRITLNMKNESSLLLEGFQDYDKLYNYLKESIEATSSTASGH